ncbi:MAG: ABC transporter ATP-binding protein [Betaproteobacteria bacterium]|nr:ABC transporter ATP-binding protein [Betaproteobacteria bacterium]MBI2960465.1 ABC transporter ATP-binding protein [Betaproteobacteria bacterium]
MLAIRDLHAGYGKIAVLHSVNLSVEEGQIVTLIGANGAGKTTLLKAVSGIIRPSAGSIEVGGANITHRPPHKIVELGISQVAEGRAILKRMTVLENLRMGAFVRGDLDIGRDIEEMFQRFPALQERQHRLAGILSGGEQQMLAIARALMARPRLLLLDEPSLGLAPMIVTQIFRTLRELQGEGKTIFLVEQNARQALQIADQAYVLERGRVTLQGSGQSFLNDPEIQRNYLGKHAA